MEIEKILLEIEECVKFREYDTAIFYTLEISKANPDYLLLAGILLYMHGEYSRCIAVLHEIDSNTSKYYKTLSFYHLKQYSLANKMLNTCSLKDDDYTGCLYLDSFLLTNVKHYFLLLQAKIKIQMGNAIEAVDCALKSTEQRLLLPAVNILVENKIYYEKENMLECGIGKYYGKISQMYLTNKEDEVLPLTHYFIDSYFISKLVVFLFQREKVEKALEFYAFLRENDFAFIQEMDLISTFLWKHKKENLLGVLAKDMLETHSQSEKTWVVLANYYSFNNKIEKSAKCLEKSLLIKESAIALSTLGYEYTARNQTTKAKAYFEAALKMQLNNGKAYFGLGVAFDTAGRLEEAEKWFIKGVELEPYDSFIQTYLVRFYVSFKKYDEALKALKTFMNIGSLTIKQAINYMQSKINGFKETEELMALEFIEILETKGYHKQARALIKKVKVRTSSYFDKKNMLERGMNIAK
ncbi:nuc2 [Ecytonucleospora hepatopenaei]|uniref:Nuc2 n=1 Tax=Ecytonucleospora hepatopenaei TaxID=646526 RepID=A0A1W0E2J2_9MICR|nr:nuc2 [Ecytonucleospora hepatopenaei]